MGEGFNDGIAASCGKRGHVEHGTDGGSAAADRPSSGAFSAVVGVGGDAGQGGDLLAGKTAKFAEFGQQYGGGRLADAWHALHELQLSLPLVVVFQELGDSFFDRLDLAIESLDDAVEGFHDESIGRLAPAVLVGHARLQELSPAADQGVQFPLFFRDFLGGRGRDESRELGQQGRVEAIKIAYGGMAATPKRALQTEAALLGQDWTDATVRTAMGVLAQDFAPLSDMRASADYRLQTAQNLLYRYYLETRPENPLAGAQVNVFAA